MFRPNASSRATGWSCSIARLRSWMARPWRRSPPGRSPNTPWRAPIHAAAKRWICFAAGSATWPGTWHWPWARAVACTLAGASCRALADISQPRRFASASRRRGATLNFWRPFRCSSSPRNIRHSSVACRLLSTPVRGWRRARFPRGLDGCKNRGRVLEQILERLDQTGGIGAVDEAMVEGRGQVHHQPHLDRSIDHHRAFDRAIHADDGDFGHVDDGRAGDATQLAEARDRNGRTAEFLAAGAAVPRRRRDAHDLGGQGAQAQALGVANHRHFEALRRLRGDADMP